MGEFLECSETGEICNYWECDLRKLQIEQGQRALQIPERIENDEDYEDTVTKIETEYCRSALIGEYGKVAADVSLDMGTRIAALAEVRLLSAEIYNLK